MREILITGMSGVGKSIYAAALQRSGVAANMSVAISDHELFSCRANYSKKLEDVRSQHLKWDVDLSILVVNDDSKSLRVDFGGLVPFEMGRIFFPQPIETAVEGRDQRTP